jgi:nicotinate-nucleotide adenylyltransferase
MISKNIQIALFGTSADPPTIGHEMVLNWLSKMYDFVVVWAADNPFKEHQTSLKHRAMMLDMLGKSVSNRRGNIILEQDFSSPRTIETLRLAKKKFAHTVRLTLIVGSDLLLQLPNWYQVDELLKEVKLLVIPRPGYPIDESNLETIRQLGGTIEISDYTGLNVSSTSFRETGDMEILPKCLVSYINEQHLYTNARKQSKKDNIPEKSTFSG